MGTGRNVHRCARVDVVHRILNRRVGNTTKAGGQTGEAFWQPESYDHWVRSEQEWGRIVRHIERGPFDQHPPAGLPTLRTWRSTPQRIPRP